MGYSRWDSNSAVYSNYFSSRSTMSREEIFKQSGMDPDMNPKGVEFREARDSEDNPRTIPIIIGLDQTGSMGRISHYMVTTGLKTMMEEILNRNTIQDPTVCIMAIGDAECREEAPLQVGQFESDIVMTKWLESIYLEGLGGGNNSESYDLPHYFCCIPHKD